MACWEKYFESVRRHDWMAPITSFRDAEGAIASGCRGADAQDDDVSLLSAGQRRCRAAIRQYLELQQIIRRVDIPVPIDFATGDTSRMVSNRSDAITAVELHEVCFVLDSQQVQDTIPRMCPPLSVIQSVSSRDGSVLFSAPVPAAIVDAMTFPQGMTRYMGATVRKRYRPQSDSCSSQMTCRTSSTTACNERRFSTTAVPSLLQASILMSSLASSTLKRSGSDMIRWNRIGIMHAVGLRWQVPV